MSAAILGRFDGGFAWQAHPGEFMERSSAALVEDGRVWLIDPVRAPGLEDEIGALGAVAGIIMTLGWHDRDVDWYARRYGVSVYARRGGGRMLITSPVQRVERDLPGSSLQLLDASGQGLLALWRESAVWWPERRVLVTGDALGNAHYFVRPGERLAVHPVRRLSPPWQLAALQPERIYVGHGTPVVERASEALARALRTARPALAAAWWHSLLSTLGRARQAPATPPDSGGPSR